MVAGLEPITRTELSGVTTWVELAVSTFTDVADAVSDIGATPATLVIDSVETVSTALVIPDTLYLRFAKGALLTKSGSGTIEFEGYGLIDPTSAIPLFSGFANGDITWTGTEWPKRISSELQFYAHARFAERVNFIDAALLGKYAVIETHPRTIDTTQTIVNEHHHLELLPGDFLNTWAVDYQIPILLKSNTSIRSNPPYSARIHESSVVGPQKIALIGAQMMEVMGAAGTCENIFVEDNYFVGNEGQTGSGGPSTVILGNCIKGGINRNIFYRTHGYNILGGYGTTGNYSENCSISYNKFIGCGTQVCAVINGRNFSIIGNHFDQRNSNGTSTYAAIDIEPNTDTGRVENGVIAHNEMDCRDVTDSSHFLFAIAVQATEAPGAKNLVIRNNNIYGADLSQTGTTLPLVTGIVIVGGHEIYCFGNSVRSGFQRAYSIRQSRWVKFFKNTAIQCTDVTGDNAALYLESCANSDLYDNNFTESYNTTRQSTGMIEAETEHAVTATGTSVTVDSTFFWLFLRVYEFYEGLRFTLNTVDYDVDSYTGPWAFTSTATIPTITTKTFVDANVTTGSENIAITAHGHLTGSRVALNTTGVVPAGLTTNRVYFVIRVDADNLKLADTLALATAGTPVNITAASGGGTHKLTPVMVTKFSNNEYWGNKAPDGIFLQSTGTSRHFNSYDIELSDYVAPDHSLALTAFVSTPINTILGVNAEAQVDPVTLIDVVNLTISGADNKQTKTGGVDATYDAGAFSVESIPEGGWLETTVIEVNTNRIIGLSYADVDQNYTAIDYGVHLTVTGNMQAIASGVAVGSAPGYSASDVIRLWRVGNTIEISQNGAAPFHTFTSVPSGNLHVDSSLATMGATLGGILLGGVGNVEALTTAEVKALLMPAPGPIGGTAPSTASFTILSCTAGASSLSHTIGGGTTITKIVIYTPSLTPASVAANTSAEEDFTVTGLAIGDTVEISGPAPTAGTIIGNVRVKATDMLSILFGNLTGGALTPASGTYRIKATRS